MLLREPRTSGAWINIIRVALHFNRGITLVGVQSADYDHELLPNVPPPPPPPRPLSAAALPDPMAFSSKPRTGAQTEDSGKRLEIFHYHYVWDGYFKSTWDQAKKLFKIIMVDPDADAAGGGSDAGSGTKFVTVLRDPVEHWLSYFYFYYEPEMKASPTHPVFASEWLTGRSRGHECVVQIFSPEIVAKMSQSQTDGVAHMCVPPRTYDNGAAGLSSFS